jgi:hypothetical protein
MIKGLPCYCNAPIVHNMRSFDDDEYPTDYVSLHRVNIKTGEITEIYTDKPYGVETDDFDLKCTRCCTSWVAWRSDHSDEFWK